jgi:NADPH:quinone reductase-like Zn-dependent oxidoreductase
MEFLQTRGLALGDRVLIDPSVVCGACRPCTLGDTALCDHFQVLGENLPGTHAQYVHVPVENVHAIPAHLDDSHASALTLAFATAWRMLYARARLLPGERVVVWGASSGVGTAALQLCSAAGIETLATTRSGEKVDELTALGANTVVVTDGDERDWLPRFTDAAHAFTGGDGVDVVFDHLGQVAWKPSMQVMRKGGRYVTCGVTSGANPPAQITRLFWKQLSMLGSTLASRTDVAQMLAFVSEHRITPRVDTVFALEDIAAAHRYLEASEQIGKVVLDVR